MDLAKIAPGRHAFQRCPCGASIIWGDLATEEEIAAYEAEHAPHVARLLARLSAVPVEIFAWFEGGRLVQIEAPFVEPEVFPSLRDKLVHLYPCGLVLVDAVTRRAALHALAVDLILGGGAARVDHPDGERPLERRDLLIQARCGDPMIVGGIAAAELGLFFRRLAALDPLAKKAGAG